MQSTALTTFLQDSKNANLNIQSAVCGQLNNIPFDSSLVINGRRPSVMGIEKSNGMMVVISNWLSHPNLSPRLTDDVWLGPRLVPRIARRHPLMSTPAVFSCWWSSWSKFLKQAGSLITGGPSALFADFQFECPCSYQGRMQYWVWGSADQSCI